MCSTLFSKLPQLLAPVVSFYAHQQHKSKMEQPSTDLDGSGASGQSNESFLFWAGKLGFLRPDGSLFHPATDQASTFISNVTRGLMTSAEGPDCASISETLLREYARQYIEAAEVYKPCEANEGEIPVPGTEDGNIYTGRLIQGQLDEAKRVPSSASSISSFDKAFDKAWKIHWEDYDQQAERWKKLKKAQEEASNSG